MPPNPQNSGNLSTCYVCDCTVRCTTLPSGACDPKYPRNTIKWGGDQCQYQDVSESANLLFWTSLLLIMTLIFAIWFLFKDTGEFTAMSAGSIPNRDKAEQKTRVGLNEVLFSTSFANRTTGCKYVDKAGKEGV